jgi:ornithine carbamoyltransferase
MMECISNQRESNPGALKVELCHVQSYNQIVAKMRLKTKNLLSVADLEPAEFTGLLDYAIDLKSRGWLTLLKNRSLALVFEKPSLRTRVSFEIAMKQLGGEVLHLSPAEVGLGKRESVPDVARVLGRYVDGIACRTFAQQNLVELAEYSGVPVINALSDYEHPCQAMADLLTIYEKKGKLKGLTMAFIGDGNNVANSLAFACGMTGMNLNIASPVGYKINAQVLKKARQYAQVSGATITSMTEPEKAVRNADVVYTDTWTSMGQEADAELRRKAFAGYQVNEKLLAFAKKDAIIMHCLPAHPGEEVAVGILDSPRSVVFDEAENRMHAQKAVLASLLS